MVFDFTKPLSDVGQKDIKRDSLLELVEYFSLNRGFLTANIYKEIIEMVRHSSLLRCLASACNGLEAKRPETTRPELFFLVSDYPFPFLPLSLLSPIVESSRLLRICFAPCHRI